MNVFLTDDLYAEITHHYIKVTELSIDGSVENEEILISVFQADVSTSTEDTGKDRVVQNNQDFQKAFKGSCE